MGAHQGGDIGGSLHPALPSITVRVSAADKNWFATLARSRGLSESALALSAIRSVKDSGSLDPYAVWFSCANPRNFKCSACGFPGGIRSSTYPRLAALPPYIAGRVQVSYGRFDWLLRSGCYVAEGSIVPVRPRTSTG